MTNPEDAFQSGVVVQKTQPSRGVVIFVVGAGPLCKLDIFLMYGVLLLDLT
jgi:hypothetical protein